MTSSGPVAPHRSPPEPRAAPDKPWVAFSFSGKYRDLVRPIAEAVEQRLGRGRVFYDEWFRDWLPGGPGDLKLQEIYQTKAEVVVVGVAGEYGSSAWPVAEWDAIRARYLRLRVHPDKKEVNRILPLRVGDGDLPGLLETTIYDEARGENPKAVADRIVNRLRTFRPDAGKLRVFLAECTPDLDIETEPVNRGRLQAFLEEQCGCSVVPKSSLADGAPGDYPARLRAELKECDAFVQLLGRFPWKGGGFDRLQFEAARQAKLKMFRFRGDLDLASVQRSHPEHHAFLNDVEIIDGAYDDFQCHLRDRLVALAQEREERIRSAQEAEKRPPGEEDPPLVRVAVRAANQDQVWKPIFQLLYEKEKILPDQLGPGDTFKDKHEGEPCHGFLILCDEQAQRSNDSALRRDTSQCRVIQMKEKDRSRRPPVGIVYWEPPPPEWSKLAACAPDRLHRVVGDELEKLAAFIEQVREVRRAQA